MYGAESKFSDIIVSCLSQAGGKRMLRHWIKILLVSCLVLTQTACPKYLTKQTEDGRLNSSEQYRGGD